MPYPSVRQLLIETAYQQKRPVEVFDDGDMIVDFSNSLQVNVKKSTKQRVFRGSKPVAFPVDAAFLAGPTEPEPYSIGPWWFWKNRAIGWTPYDKECTLLLQKAHVYNRERVTLPIDDGRTFYVEFKSMSQINAITKSTKKVKHEQWQWWDEVRKKYIAYDDKTTAKLEKMYKQGRPTCQLKMSSGSYVIHFFSGTQWRLSTGFKRKIRREGMHPPPLKDKTPPGSAPALKNAAASALCIAAKSSQTQFKSFEVTSSKGGRFCKVAVSKQGMEWVLTPQHTLILLNPKKTLRAFQIVHDSALRPNLVDKHVQVILNYTRPSKTMIITIQASTSRQVRFLVDSLEASLRRLRAGKRLRLAPSPPALTRYYWALLRRCALTSLGRRVLLPRVRGGEGEWEVGDECEFRFDCAWLPGVVDKVIRKFLSDSVSKIRVSYRQGTQGLPNLVTVSKDGVRMRSLPERERCVDSFLAQDEQGTRDREEEDEPWLLFCEKDFQGANSDLIPLLKTPSVRVRDACDRAKEGWAIPHLSVVRVWRWLTKDGTRFGCITHVDPDKGTFDGIVPDTHLYPLIADTPLTASPALGLSQRFRNKQLEEIAIVPGPPPLMTFGDKVRVVFISDTHGRHRHIRLPPGDILVHGGDIVDAYPSYGALKKDNSLSHQEDQLKDFLNWLSKHASRYKHVVIIPGNHDVILDKSKFKDPGITHPKKGPGPKNCTGWEGRGPSRDEHARAMASMQACRLGGDLPNNCVFVGESSRDMVLPTGVAGKVLRLFASPICKRRAEDHQSGAFCWGSESGKGISRRVGKDFMVVRPDRKYDRVIPLSVAPDLSLTSVEALKDAFALTNGDRVEVLRWEAGFSKEHLWDWGRYHEEGEEEEDASASVDEASIFGYVRFQPLSGEARLGYVRAAYLHDLQPGKLAVVRRFDGKSMRTGLRRIATTSLEKKAFYSKHRTVRPGVVVRIRETAMVRQFYFAKVQTDLKENNSDESCGWIRCINLQEAGIFDRERLWEKIPDGGVDILLTHTPPKGVLSDSVNGCEHLSRRIREMVHPPRFHLFGHEHRFKDVHCRIHGTGSRPLDFFNGSLRNNLPNNNAEPLPENQEGARAPIVDPVVLDFPLKNHHVYTGPTAVLALCLCRVCPALAEPITTSPGPLIAKQRSYGLIARCSSGFRKLSALPHGGRRLNFLRWIQDLLGVNSHILVDLSKRD